MSKVIDERVVEMRFDNKDFESNVQTSLKTIDKLKDSLNFDESTKSVERFQDSLRHFSLDDIGNAVTGLADKFNWGNIFKVELLRNVIDDIYNTITGTFNRIKGELHLEDVDPVSNMIGGWNKYAEKTQSVATIMAATGKSMEYVNEQMDKLLFFTDETSYSFTDMAGNIGKFTANGIELEDASRAMEGIATWAARSGQNASTASRVMYNLSQAIGMGALKLQDWKSVELANMGTKEFKEMAIAIGLTTGALVEVDGTVREVNKGLEVTSDNFRETLQTGWLDSNTLVEVLNEYGKAGELIGNIHDQAAQFGNLLAKPIVELADASKEGKISIYDLGEALDMNEKEIEANASELEKIVESIRLLGSEEYEFSLATYKAAQEARTFGDAMASVADAVSSQWMTTFELIFGQYDQAKKLWYDLADNLIGIFGEGIEARNKLLEEANFSGWEAFTNGIEEAGVAMTDLERSVRNIIGARAFESLIADAGSFKDAVMQGKISIDIVKQAIDQLTGASTTTIEETQILSGEYEKMAEIALNARKGKYNYFLGDEHQIQQMMEMEGVSREFAEQALALAYRTHELGRELTEEEAQEYMTSEKMIKTLEESIELTDEQKKHLQELADQMNRESASKNFQEALMDIGATAYAVVDTIRTAFRTLFPRTTAAQLSQMASNFKTLTGNVRDFFENSEIFQNVMTALIFPLRVIWDVLKAAMSLLQPLGSLLFTILSPLIWIVNKFGEWRRQIAETEGEVDPFAETLNKVAEALSLVIKFVEDVIKYVGNAIKEKLIERFSEPLEKLSEFLQKSREKRIEWLDNLIETLKNADVASAGDKILGILSSIYHFGDTIKNVFSSLGEKFNNFKARIDAYRQVFGPENMSTIQAIIKILKVDAYRALTAIETKLKQLGINIGPVKSVISKFISTITEKFNALRDKITPIIDNFKNKFKSLGESDGLSFLERAFLALKDTASMVFNMIKDKLAELGINTESISTKFNEIKTSISEFFSSFTTETEEGKGKLQEFIDSLGITLPKVLTGGGIALAAAGIIGFIAKLKEAKENKGDTVLDIIKEKLNPFADSIEKLKTATSSFNIVSFAIGIGILAASLIALSYVPTEKLTASLGVMGGALIEFLGTLAGVNKIMGDKGTLRLVGMGLGMMAIAKALKMIGEVFEMYKEIKFDSVLQVVKVLGLLMVAVSSLRRIAKIAGKFSFKLSNGLGLIAAATAFWMFGKVLESYAKLKIGKENILKVLGGLLTAIITLGLIAAVAGKTKFKLSNGLGLIALATSLLIFANVIDKLGGLDRGRLIQGGISVVLLGLVISGILALVNLASKHTGIRQAIGQLISLTAITVALIAFAAVAVLLGLIPKNILQKGWDSVFALSMLITALTAMIGQLGKSTGLRGAVSSIIMLIGLSVALVAFGAVVAALGILSPLMLPGLAVLALMIVELAAIFALIKFLIVPNVKQALGGVLAIGLFGLALLPMVYTLKQLGDLDYEATVAGLRLLGNLLGAFAILLAVSIGVGLLASIAGPILLIGMAVVAVIMLAFVGAIAVLVHELEKLAELDTDAARDGLQCVREELEILTDLAQKFIDNEGLFTASLQAAVVCFAFGIGLHQLANDTRILGLSNAQAASEALRVVQEEIELMFNLGDYLTQNQGSFTSALGASAIAFAFGIGLHGLANDTRILGLANATAASEAIQPMSELITLMFGLATTVGSDPSVFKGAAEVSGELILFATALLPLVGETFLAGLADAQDASTNLSTIMSLVAQLFALATIVGEDGSLYESAKKVSENIKDFGNALAGLVAEAFISQFIDAKKSEDGFAAVTAMIDFLVSTAQSFMGENSIDEGATNLVEVLQGFGVALGNLIGDAIIAQLIDYDKSTEGFTAVQEVVNWLLTIAQSFMGENSIDDGASAAVEVLKGFGAALGGLIVAEFFSQFVDADKALKGLKPVKSIVSILIRLANAFNKDSGMFTSAQEAAEACSTFAGTLKDLTKSEKKIQKTDATAALAGLGPVEKIVEILIGLAKEFAQTEGMAAAAVDASNSVATFSDKLKSIAGTMSSKNWTDVSTENVTTTITAIVDGIKDLAAIDGDIAAVESSLNSISTIFSTAASLTSTGFLGGRTTDTSGVSALFASVKDGLTDLSNNVAILDIGGQITSGIIQNLDSGTVISTINNLGMSIVNTLNSFTNSFYIAGQNLAIGLINGMNSMAQAVYDAGFNLGAVAEQGAMDATQEASPSKVFTRIGEYLGVGMANGMSNKTTMVRDASEEMSNQAIDIAESLSARIAEILNGDPNQFTITPVLDMSNIQAGASQYSKLFSGSGHIGISSGISRNLASAQTAQEAYNQFLAAAPAANASGEHIQVNVYAAEGQSEASIADSVINRISEKTSRRRFAFG